MRKYSVQEILMDLRDLVPTKTFADVSEQLKDFKNMTKDTLYSGTTQFARWLCMLPITTTLWFIKTIFKIQISIVNAILLSFFPNLPQSYDETKEVVLPAVGIIKASVLR